MTDVVLEEIHLAATQGFCAGVASALEIVERALEKYGTPLYVRHHIVHNTTVINDFEKKGVIFIEELSDVPEGSTVVFSAHGTAPLEYDRAKERGLRVIDATCPLVTKVHREAVRFSKKNVQTILIGHKGHQELIGTSGYVNPDQLHVIENVQDVANLEIDESRPVGYLTQTTLSVSDAQNIIKALKERYPDIQGPPKADICYATQNRQNVVLDLAKICDLIIVCGSPHSSNSNRLRECAINEGVVSYIIDTVSELDLSWLEGVRRVGITSGASVPKKVVDNVVHHIHSVYGHVPIYQEESVEKNIKFPIPAI